MVPEDGINLNRAFPGNAKGSLSARLAVALENALYPVADFLADLHGGDYNEVLHPVGILSHVWRCGNQPYIFDSSSDIDSSLPCAILCTERTLQLGSSEECPCIADRAGRTGNINILTKNNGSQKIFRSYSECIS